MQTISATRWHHSVRVDGQWYDLATDRRPDGTFLAVGVTPLDAERQRYFERIIQSRYLSRCASGSPRAAELLRDGYITGGGELGGTSFDPLTEIDHHFAGGGVRAAIASVTA